MITSITKNKITFTGIANEAQLEMVVDAAEATDCKIEMQDFATKAVITGNLEAYIEYWNAQL